MEGAGNGALALDLARVAQVDELHAGLAVQRTRRLDVVRGDQGQGFVDQLGGGLLHRDSPDGMGMAASMASPAR